jgi:acylphosphatase
VIKMQTLITSIYNSPVRYLLVPALLLSACSRDHSQAPASHPAGTLTPATQFSINTAKPTLKTERRTIYFSGNVQGVGFRNTTVSLSSGTELAGTVRNLSDGRVELIVEGTPAEIDGLVARLREHFGAAIRKVEQSAEKPQGLSPGMRVIY